MLVPKHSDIQYSSSSNCWNHNSMRNLTGNTTSTSLHKEPTKNPQIEATTKHLILAELITVYVESTASTCCLARYFSLRSFHSSITRPSPITRGPVSDGGFLRASRAASASANWRFNFSSAGVGCSASKNTTLNILSTVT
uniref:Structural molecule n=1 Tax=Rhizophora mucronata TaxID=61149 RepID=A0A2P2KVD7_RHIMU